MTLFGPPVLTTADTGAVAGDDNVGVTAFEIEFKVREGSAHVVASRAVSGTRSCGMPFVLGVPLDRFDHQVECVDAVDFAGHAVGTAWREATAFGEVEQAIHTPGVEVQHDQHRARSVFYPRE